MTAKLPAACAVAFLLAACPSAARAQAAALATAALPAAPMRQRPATPPAGQAEPQPPLLGDQSDGSRARPVHRIPLRDSEGEVIRTTDQPLLPFSTSHTCGADCHDVSRVSRGWHFNTTAAGSAIVRRGEPWILVDADTGTQLPLSYHPWPGAFSPDAIGITPWAFAKAFGGRTPGGLTGDREPTSALKTRWTVSGSLEPNCLACHDASPAYDQPEYARQIGLENFRWAAAAASGMAFVTGAAKEMPNTFDHLLPVVEDALLPRMPTITYAPDRFLPGAKVLFDVVREVPARRCYFCHSTVDISQTGQGRWNADADIHLARGLTCVDCHHNGLDHAMTRGYDGDPAAAAGGANAAAVTCRGCHLASEPDRVFARGRAGAPYPRHEGLPPVHLQKLSCTACHSGPQPEQTARRFKTSLAHRLGGLNVNKSGEALPHLYYPVFTRHGDGVMTPNRLLWPAFWGRLVNGVVVPLAPERVKETMVKARLQFKRAPDGNWSGIDAVTLAQVLRLLGADAASAGTPVYVAGGRLHRLNGAGGVLTEDHPSASPYLWPIAHDVRPAALALGARGCQDCHDERAAIFAGRVPVDSPLVLDRGASWTMSRFQRGLDAVYLADFARTFRYRPWLKGTVAASAGALLLFLLAFVLPALGRLSAATRSDKWKRVVVNAAGVASCGTVVASGFPDLLSGNALTGYRLIIHVGSAPVFTVAAVAVTLFWAHRNRLDRGDWSRVRRPFGFGKAPTQNSYAVLIRKLSFWTAVTAAIPSVVSATLAMFPILRSADQAMLFLVHRYSVAVLAIAASMFMVFSFVAWLRRHQDDPETAHAGSDA